MKTQPGRNGNGNYDESQYVESSEWLWDWVLTGNRLWVHDKFEDNGRFRVGEEGRESGIDGLKGAGEGMKIRGGRDGGRRGEQL